MAADPRLPIKKRWIFTDKLGRTCIAEVSIQRTSNKSLYPPDGVKSVFIVKRERTIGSDNFEAIVLIDNHEPFGFHQHSKLPEKHEYRQAIHALRWQDAWHEFEKLIEEILNES